MKSFIEGMVCLNMCSNNFVVKLRITTGFNYISTVCGCTKICKIHMYFGWQGTCPSLWGNRTVPSSAKHDLFCHLMCSCKSIPLGLVSSDHTIVVVYTCICSYNQEPWYNIFTYAWPWEPELGVKDIFGGIPTLSSLSISENAYRVLFTNASVNTCNNNWLTKLWS